MREPARWRLSGWPPRGGRSGGRRAESEREPTCGCRAGGCCAEAVQEAEREDGLARSAAAAGSSKRRWDPGGGCCKLRRRWDFFFKLVFFYK